MCRRALFAASLFLWTVLASDAVAQRRRAIGAGGQITASVITAPQPVKVDGVPRLAWEVHLRNLRNEDFTVTAVEVRDAGSLIIGFSGQQIEDRMVNLPLRPPASSLPHALVRAGESALIFFLIMRGTEEMPPFITHVIHLSTPRGVEKLHAPTTPVRMEPPVALGPPLRGPSWQAMNGLDDSSPHMRSVTLQEDRVTIPRRFAIDWVKVDSTRSTYSGDVTLNSSFYAFGSEVLAVADGVVAATQDGFPDNVPRQAPPSPITPETSSGNHVIINVGGGKYAVYAHLQQGSLRVSVGDPVTKGAVIARVGNSGNSGEPHLHFQMCNVVSLLDCDGLPYVFESFSTADGPKQLEFPMNEVVVDFGT